MVWLWRGSTTSYVDDCRCPNVRIDCSNRYTDGVENFFRNPPPPPPPPPAPLVEGEGKQEGPRARTLLYCVFLITIFLCAHTHILPFFNVYLFIFSDLNYRYQRIPRNDIDEHVYTMPAEERNAREAVSAKLTAVPAGEKPSAEVVKEMFEMLMKYDDG